MPLICLFSINIVSIEKAESTQISQSVNNKNTLLSSKDDASGYWQPAATTYVYFKNIFICRHPWFQLFDDHKAATTGNALSPNVDRMSQALKHSLPYPGTLTSFHLLNEAPCTHRRRDIRDVAASILWTFITQRTYFAGVLLLRVGRQAGGRGRCYCYIARVAV